MTEEEFEQGVKQANTVYAWVQYASNWGAYVKISKKDALRFVGCQDEIFQAKWEHGFGDLYIGKES